MRGQVYDPYLQEVKQMINADESETLEFKETIPSYLGLAKTISAFANANGGVILIGVREIPRTVVGINYPALVRIYDLATENLEPAGGVTLHEVNVGGKHIGMIRVNKYEPLMSSKAGVYIRDGSHDRPLTTAEIAARIAPPAAAAQIDINIFANALATNTQTIENLRVDLAYAQSIKGQWKMLLITSVLSFILGFASSYLVNIVWKLQGN